MIPPIKGICPLIQVFDMPAALQFYRDILNFKVVQASSEHDDADWVLLEHDGAELMLNTAYEKKYRPGKPDELRIEAHNDITFYFYCQDLPALYDYLKGKGLPVSEPSTTGYGWSALNLKDPDGYNLCFHYPISNL